MAESVVVLLAFEIARVNGLERLWLETNSSLSCDAFNNYNII